MDDPIKGDTGATLIAHLFIGHLFVLFIWAIYWAVNRYFQEVFWSIVISLFDTLSAFIVIVENTTAFIP